MKKARRPAWARAVSQGLSAWGSLAGVAWRAPGAKAVQKAAAKAGRKAVKKAVNKAVGQALGRAVGRAVGLAPAVAAVAKARRTPPAGAGRWSAGVALGLAGARRWRLYSPPGLAFGEKLPLLVLLHGCTQDAAGFAASTRMHSLATRGRFLVLFPEQDRLANPQGCWNWHDTEHGRAQAEAALVLAAIDQVCLLHGADRGRVLLAGLSAGGSLAVLLASQSPARFAGVVLHSGVPPGTAHSTLTALRAMQGRRATAPLALAAGRTLPPLLVIHGSEDGVVSPRNAEAAVSAWAAAGAAVAGPPRLVQRGARLPMRVTEHRAGGQALATLVLVQGLGHAWSGGAAGKPYSDPRGPDASRLVWAFAQKQFRRRGG